MLGQQIDEKKSIFSAEQEIPSAKAGFFSLMTFSWQTSMMWNIYRRGVEHISNLTISDTESTQLNTDRWVGYTLALHC